MLRFHYHHAEWGAVFHGCAPSFPAGHVEIGSPLPISLGGSRNLCYMAGMKELNPFTLSPDPEYMYRTDGLEETLDKVRFTLDRRQGLTVIYGDIGHGKSTVVRHLHDEYRDRDDCAVAYLPTPDYKTDLQFLKAICDEFELPRRHSKIDQEQELKRFLFERYSEDKNVVLLVDEAQRLRGAVLELLRSLLNFETNSAKLINIVLCGQLELRDTLRDRSKKALRQRIFLVSTLNALSLEDTTAAIQFRCDRAGVPNTFTEEAVEAIFRYTKGIPRLVVKLCQVAWLFSLRNRLSEIPADLVTEALEHIEDEFEELAEVVESARAAEA